MWSEVVIADPAILNETEEGNVRCALSNFDPNNMNHFSAMGCPSLCCEHVLLLLVTKEADLASNQAEDSQVGNPKRDTRKKKGE